MEKVELKKISREDFIDMFENYKRSFINTDFSRVDLSGIDFAGCYFRHCNFTKTNMISSNLVNSAFVHCNIHSLSMKSSDLSYVIFDSCDIKNINFSDTNLSNCDFFRCKIQDCKVSSTTKFFALQCPEEGSFIGWKKADNCIIKLLIPEDAKRSSATSRECRCSKVQVLEIIDLESGDSIPKVQSNYDPNFIYKVGEIVEVENFDNNRWKECAAGIHFFITRREAEDYFG